MFNFFYNAFWLAVSISVLAMMALIVAGIIWIIIDMYSK